MHSGDLFHLRRISARHGVLSVPGTAVVQLLEVSSLRIAMSTLSRNSCNRLAVAAMLRGIDLVAFAMQFNG
jgi:hypothetical protein